MDFRFKALIKPIRPFRIDYNTGTTIAFNLNWTC